MQEHVKVKRNILLNPGPATTTDTVKMAQVVPDICPREKAFADMMKVMREDFVRIVHGDPGRYTSVLFCGSGTINMDVCLNSLLPEGTRHQPTQCVRSIWKRITLISVWRQPRKG